MPPASTAASAQRASVPPRPVAALSWRRDAGPARTPAPLVHAAARAAVPGVAGSARAGHPAARALQTITADVRPREPAAPVSRAAPPATPPPDLRAIADRVYDALVDRMRQERRARGF